MKGARALSIRLIVRFVGIANVALAFVVPHEPRIFRPKSYQTQLRVTAVDAIAALESSQAASVQKIDSAIPDLVAKPDFAWNADMVGGCRTTLDARDAPGPANVAWFSSICVASKMSSLQIFNGPLTSAPHLVSRCVAVGDSMRLTLDFRPRAYGAYETRRPDGSYPGPDELGRKSFEYSGARLEFDNNFGNEELKAFISSTLAGLEGAAVYDPNPTELDMLTRGPLYTCLEMPITDGNIATIVSARQTAADFWLRWSQDPQHTHRPGAPVNSQYVYDTKFKQNAFGALLNEYSSVFGPLDGQKLAVGDSGPLDEAYVGGGS